ncbi:MAG: hypothetical protein AAGE43_03280 [Pseudomonadota bacterium]
MAALNIANEFLSNRGQAAAASEFTEGKVSALVDRLSEVLAEQKQLNL